MSLYKTVFLADDDSEDREIFMEAVKSVDSSVRFMSASNGAIALQTLQNDILERPDLIFLDLNMPILDGKQLLSELKKNDGLRNIPVIMYSTFLVKKISLSSADLVLLTACETNEV
ncbi:MAG: response regulator [Bacteroidota bacterium]